MSPSSGPSLDLDAVSGICGSISIACWVVVFSPQIFENFRRSSADGLSLAFIIVWLLGDVFNILGAVLQGVLPTMIVLAVYYTAADMVLLGQCFYYRGFTFSDASACGESQKWPDEEAIEEEEAPTEESPLLSQVAPAPTSSHPRISDADRPSRGSMSSFRSFLANNVDPTHLSPATPFLPSADPQTPTEPLTPRSALTTLFLNTTALVVVSLVGVLGWYLTSRSSHTSAPRHHHHNQQIRNPSEGSSLHFDIWGQIFGYLCAVLYLASRVPQILLNHRRKSTEGVSMLFFLFACVGNLTYVLSIFAYEPDCARVIQDIHGGVVGRAGIAGSRGAGSWACEEGEWRREYGKYVLVNASWLIGSAGTLMLDLMIFGQFWMYRGTGSKEAD